MASRVEALLLEHRFNKGRGVCRCGLEMSGRGQREADHRAHLAELIEDALGTHTYGCTQPALDLMEVLDA